MAENSALLGIRNAEKRVHGFVVGDALGIGAAHDVAQHAGQRHLFFLHHLVVFDDAERHIGRNDGEAVQFGIAEKLVADLDDALAPHLVAFQIETHHDGRRFDFFQMQEAHHFKKFGAGYVVDDGAVFNGRHHKFFAFHSSMFFLVNE